jgi:hypothetical protein
MITGQSACEAEAIKAIRMNQSDPFTGTWKFNVDKSRLSTRPPRNWIQQIVATSAAIQVREEVSRADGSTSVWAVQANYDGRDYPIYGSVPPDTIAYTRDGECMIGTAKKDGIISLLETIVVLRDGSLMTMTYSAFAGTKEVATGTAVFDKLHS